MSSPESPSSLRTQISSLQSENSLLKRKLSLCPPSESGPLSSAPTYAELQRREEKLKLDLIETDAQASRVPTMEFENNALIQRNKELKGSILRLESDGNRNEKLKGAVEKLRMENEELRKKEERGEGREGLYEVLREQLGRLKEAMDGNGSAVVNMDEYRERFEAKSREVEALQLARGETLAKLEETRRSLFDEKCAHTQTRKAVGPVVGAIEQLTNGEETIRVRVAPDWKHKDNQGVDACRTQLMELRDGIDGLREETMGLAKEKCRETERDLMGVKEMVGKRLKAPQSQSNNTEMEELKRENTTLQFSLEMEQKATKQLKKTEANFGNYRKLAESAFLKLQQRSEPEVGRKRPKRSLGEQNKKAAKKRKTD